MKTLKCSRFYLFVLLFLLSQQLMAQNPTTQGTDFWLSFMRNGYRSGSNSEKLTLIVSAKRDCNVTLNNPILGWTRELTVLENEVATYIVPDNVAYNSQKGGVANTGLHVSSTDTISLYIANEAENSYDASNVLPTMVLGSHYLVQTNQSIGEMSSHQGENRASFLVLATENQTRVSIIPTALTDDNHPGGQAYEITLDRGQCYHVMTKNFGASNDTDGDFSGTVITSNDDKPIAVFNGNCITSIPGNLNEGYDHVFEQAMPTDHWGKRFVVTATNAPSNWNIQADQVKVTALENNTAVKRDGEDFAVMNAGESRTFSMEPNAKPAILLESDRPVAVYLYNHSHGNSSPAYGDPSMVWISPVEQTVYEVTFSTFDATKVEKHYVNVICYTSHTPEMVLDGASISDAFHVVPSSPELSYARVELSHQTHTMHCPGGFVAHVYGLGENEGYAYSVGSSAKQLTKQLFVDDVLSTEYPDGFTLCQNESVRFRFDSNVEFHHVEWDFGDGSNGTGQEVTHNYSLAGDFNVQGVVFRDESGNVSPHDTVGITMHVMPVDAPRVIDSITCASSISYLGQDYEVPGNYTIPVTSEHGCESVVELHLFQGDEIRHDTTVTACEHFEWKGEDYWDSGDKVFRVEMATPEGCDSLYVLHLTIANPPANTQRSLSSCDAYDWHGLWCEQTGDYILPFTTPEGCEYDSVLHFTREENPELTIDTVVCDQLFWKGHLYSESDVYSLVVPVPNGCDTLITLNLTVNHTPQLGSIHGNTQVHAANSFWSGTYQYYIDSTELNTSQLHWELEGEENWRLVANGASCLVTATSEGTMRLRVWAEGDGGCYSEAMIAILSGGFDVDEVEADQAMVYPNPTKGTLYVEGDELLGVSVYDLSGQRLLTVNAVGESSVEVDVHELKPSLYIAKIQTCKGNKMALFTVL